MTESIVHEPDGHDKVSRAHVISILRRLGDRVRDEVERDRRAADLADVVARHERIDDPVRAALRRVRLQRLCRRLIDLIDPRDTASDRPANSIRPARGWRAAVEADRRSRRPDDGDLPTSAHDPR